MINFEITIGLICSKDLMHHHVTERNLLNYLTIVVFRAINHKKVECAPKLSNSEKQAK